MYIMAIELKIKFDGAAHGLKDHRLSLKEFGQALNMLLKALQEAACELLMSEAREGTTPKKRRSQAKKASKFYDLQISTIEEGSTVTGLILDITGKTAAQRDLPQPHDPDEQIKARVISQLISDIVNESQGKACNDNARQFIKLIPKGVTHEYCAIQDGITIKHAKIAKISLTNTKSTPRLIKIVGTVSALGLNPASPYILFKYHDKTVKCFATIPQVEQAWCLREAMIIAALFYGSNDESRPRLFWMTAADKPPVVPTIEQTIEELSTKWGDTLMELAK